MDNSPIQQLDLSDAILAGTWKTRQSESVTENVAMLNCRRRGGFSFSTSERIEERNVSFEKWGTDLSPKKTVKIPLILSRDP
jgi:hypothetical protein